MLRYQSERPEGGQIVNGVLIKYTPFIILYTLAEGAAYNTLGCENEELADSIMKRFEEHGDMDNPRKDMSELQPQALKPYSMLKVKTKASKVWVPN